MSEGKLMLSYSSFYFEAVSVAKKVKSEDLFPLLEYATSATKKPALFWEGLDGVYWQLTNGEK